MNEKIKILALVGSGIMGSQIASRAAVFGYNVRLYDSSADALNNAREFVKSYTEQHFEKEGGEPADAISRVTFHDNLSDAVKEADLIIEAIPEKLDLKKSIFAEIEKNAPSHTIIATNSSSIPVSKIEDAVEGKDRVVNIHFAQPIPERNYIEIMKGTETSDETFKAAEDWSRSIDCIPLLVEKECMGFVVNRVWRAVKRESLASWANGNADLRDIDRGWMKLTGMIAGPFGGMDFVGLDVVYDIEMSYYNDSKDPKDKPPQALKDMIDRGELGMKSGKGFYTWPDAEFLKPDFLKV